jgi:hypothetical protein
MRLTPMFIASIAGVLSCGSRTELTGSYSLTPLEDARAVLPPDTTGSVVPVRLLAHADAHFAVMSDGTLRMWGHSTIPGLIDPNRPSEVPGVRDVVAIRGAAESFQYITRAGGLFRVNDRDLRLPGTEVRGYPRIRDFHRSGSNAEAAALLTLDGVALSRVSIGDEFSTVAAPVPFRIIGGYDRLLAVGEDGNLYSWDRGGPFSVVRIESPFRVRDVRRECILSDAGSLACRGVGFGADGIPREADFVAGFTRISGAHDVVQWIERRGHLVMLRTDGVLLRAGLLSRNGCLRIPDAQELLPSAARVVSAIRDVVELSDTGTSVCLLFRNHEVACCGLVLGGSLGDGRTLESETFVRVEFE